MKSNLLKLSVLSTVILLGACTNNMPNLLGNHFNAPKSAQIANANADILGELIVLNQDEVNIAKLGMKRAHNKKVKAY